jgi:hypothetical protein
LVTPPIETTMLVPLRLRESVAICQFGRRKEILSLVFVLSFITSYALQVRSCHQSLTCTEDIHHGS